MNSIKVTLSPDRRTATVCMFLNGKAETWIEFDYAQLGELLKHIQSARAAMKGILLPH